MALFPEAQRAAQAEIDAVLGPNTLPTFADRDKLPYVNALIKEVYRWNPVGPLGAGLSSVLISVCADDAPCSLAAQSDAERCIQGLPHEPELKYT